MPVEEFWDGLNRAGPCWLWTGAQDSRPTESSVSMAHCGGAPLRLEPGQRPRPPAGSRISQVCGACCNPEHLLSASTSRSHGRESGPAGLDRWSRGSPESGSFASR